MSVVSARGTECSSHGSGALPQLSVLRSGVLVMQLLKQTLQPSQTRASKDPPLNARGGTVVSQ